MPQKLEEAYIQATRKAELLAENRVQVVLIATHLNAFNKENYPQEKGEVFFIDVYQSTQNTKKFFENGYHLTLNNGETPIKITELKRKDLQGFMQHNAMRWGEYYLVIIFASRQTHAKFFATYFVPYRIWREFLKFWL